MFICERRGFKSRTRQSSTLKIGPNTYMSDWFRKWGRSWILHYNLRRFSFAYQRFSLDITTVHYEDITENDRRVKFLWKALENFTNGKITVVLNLYWKLNNLVSIFFSFFLGKCQPFRRCLAYDIFMFVCPDDRSRFLRFVTGRRRLPAPLYICPGRRWG